MRVPRTQPSRSTVKAYPSHALVATSAGVGRVAFEALGMGDKARSPSGEGQRWTVLLLAVRWLVSAPAAVPAWEAPSEPVPPRAQMVWFLPWSGRCFALRLPRAGRQIGGRRRRNPEGFGKFRHHNRRIDAEIIVGRRLERK
jgi:hypothetical protein